MDKVDENWANDQLKKASLLLGVNELKKFDYKSINSIRKLAKTFGCDEYELIKTFSSQLNLPDKSLFLESIQETKSSTIDLSEKSSSVDACKSDEKKTKKSKSLMTKSWSIKGNGTTKQSKSKIKSENGTNTSQGSNEKSFKRIMSGKKLPSKFQLREKKSPSVHIDGKNSESTINTSLSSQTDSTTKDSVRQTSDYYVNVGFQPRQASVEKVVCQGQRREVTLYRDENLGFGFIAGSEKPLKIRFVTPDGPGKDKLLNGDEILAINDEDVEFASREHVISLIRKSVNKIKLVVKQPTPKSNNSLLLTEDKKAIKKSSQPKNKVRFQLDNEHAIFSSPSTSSLKSSASLMGSQHQKYHNYENEHDLKVNKPTDRESFIRTLGQMTSPSNPLISSSTPSMAITNSYSILKVHLENRAIKSFKYDRNTCVKDVLWCLKEKLAINNIEYFGLVLKPSNHSSISKFKLLHELQHLHEINDTYLRNGSCFDSSSSSSSSSDGDSDPGESMDDRGDDPDQPSRKQNKFRKRRKGKPINYICLFRFVFVPSDFQQLKFNDENAFNYLYEQSVNDVMNDRFGSELQYEMILHLSTLNLLHEYVVSHAANTQQTSMGSNASSSSYTTISNSFNSSGNRSEDLQDINMKLLQEEMVLENFLPKAVLDSNILKRKDLKKLILQNLSWFFEKKFFDKANIQIEYLKCMNELLQYSGRIYFVNLLEQMKETFIIVGSNYGIATFIDLKSKTLLNLAKFDTIENIRVSNHPTLNLIRVDLDIFEIRTDSDIVNKTLTFGFLKDEYLEFLYLIQGYLRINIYDLKNRICPIQVIKSSEKSNLNVPVFLVKHPQRKSCQKPIVPIRTSEKSIYSLTSEQEEDTVYKCEPAPVTESTKIEVEVTKPTEMRLKMADEAKCYSTISGEEDEDNEEFELTEETLVVTNPREDLVVRSVEETTFDDKLSPVGDKKLEINEPPLVYVDQMDLNQSTRVFPTQPSTQSNESFFTYNKIRLRIVDTSTKTPNESLPLIESFQFVDQNDEISEASKSIAVGGWNSGVDVVRIEGREFELKEFSGVEMLKRTREDDDEMKESEEEIKSISSIEGSLKAGLGNDRSLCGNSSSTPLTCLYPNLVKLEGAMEVIKTREDLEKFRQRSNYLMNDTTTSNLNNNDDDEITPTTTTSNLRDSTLLMEAAHFVEATNQAQNVDFIDLSKVDRSNPNPNTSIQNMKNFVFNSLSPPPPPPLQFSDHFQLNEFKRNDVEIESGIESDSSNDIQQMNNVKSFENEAIFNQNNLYIKDPQPVVTGPASYETKCQIDINPSNMMNDPNKRSQTKSNPDSSSYVRQKGLEPRLESFAFNVRPSEVRAKERMLKASSQEASKSQIASVQGSSNKVLTLAKTYEPTSNRPVAKEIKASIIKIIDNKITDFAPRHLSSPSVSSSINSSPSSPHSNKSFKNEALIQLHSASATNAAVSPVVSSTISINTAMVNKDPKLNNIEINVNSVFPGSNNSSPQKDTQNLISPGNKKRMKYTKSNTTSIIETPKMVSPASHNDPKSSNTSNIKFVQDIKSFFDRLNLTSPNPKITIKTGRKSSPIKSKTEVEIPVKVELSQSPKEEKSVGLQSPVSISRREEGAESNAEDVPTHFLKVKYLSFPPSKAKLSNKPGSNYQEIGVITSSDSQTLVKALISPNKLSHQLQDENNLLNKKCSFASSELSGENLISPKKGALKKRVVKQKDLNSFGRSTLKVRWKDMIEISNVELDESDEFSMEQPRLSRISVNKETLEQQKNRTNEPEEINDIYGDEDVDDDELDDDEDTEESSDLSEEERTHGGRMLNGDQALEKMIASEKRPGILASCGVNKTSEHLLLEPLHATGREFEKEMSDRIEKLNRIKGKTSSYVNLNSERVFDEIQLDLDGILYEIHSTIEHIRVSSMLTNPCVASDTDPVVETNFKQLGIHEFTDRCNDLANESKSMINSALLTASSAFADDHGQNLRYHIKNTMALLCSLVAQCFESCYLLLYRNEKLDEIRQLLIQILNLLNTFRSSLNVTYLFSIKKFNEKNSSLLTKQSTNLENDICFLIEYYKIIF